jgi:hypothetical protein
MAVMAMRPPKGRRETMKVEMQIGSTSPQLFENLAVPSVRRSHALTARSGCEM